MSDQLAPDAALASEVPATPEVAPPAGSDTPDSATGLADQPADTSAAPEGDATESPAVNGQGQRKPARDRIAEVIAERNAERERVKAAQEQAEFWRNQAQGQRTNTAEPAKPAPKPADFDYDMDRWSDAHAKWTDEQIEIRSASAAQRLSEQRGQQEHSHRVLSKFQEREAEFAKVTPGYYEAVSDPRLAQFSTPTIIEVIGDSEVCPAISKHLADNPHELARISALSPLQQARELGRIETAVSKAKAPAPTTKHPLRTAPPPPRPVGGAQPAKSLQDMDIHEYMENRTWGRPG